MVDDMGYSDPGCYGGEVETPHVDALAADGLRFTEFHNASRCCPTRASLMTGLYPHQVGLAKNGQSLTRDGVTIAEALRPAGYQTAMVGKWHLSYTPTVRDHLKWVNHQIEAGPFAPLETYPVNRGFDKHYGIIWGVIDYFDPFSLVDGTEPVKEVPEDYYITDAITDKALEYLDEFTRGRRARRPFFLYVAHCAPHWPLHALPEEIEKYEGTYQPGWERIRRARYERMVEMGLFDRRSTPLPPLTGGGDWDKLSEKEKAYQAHNMAVHAAMIDRVDQGIGRIMRRLKEAGRFDNTMVLFLSDNGASPEIPRKPGYDRPSQTRDGRPIRYAGQFERAGPETTYGSIGPQWASVANTPFRYWKKESFEGGNCTPLVVHWPAGLKTRPGSITNHVGHVLDVMPTCLEVAGAEYPGEYNGHRILPLEGTSLVPVFEGKQAQSHDVLFWEHMGGRAVRSGDWKLVALEKQPWELYDLARDRTETRNLARDRPEKVSEMEALWNGWAKKVGIQGLNDHF